MNQQNLKKMEIDFDKILELLKVALLVTIVILLLLNYFGGGSRSKYELSTTGAIRINKVTGETYILDTDSGVEVYKKIKIKE